MFQNKMSDQYPHQELESQGENSKSNFNRKENKTKERVSAGKNLQN